jgi:hypothetical protein
MSAHQTTAETSAAIVAKAAPPATVSIASLAGFQVSEILLWATLVYTVLMIVHKLWQMYQDWTKP